MVEPAKRRGRKPKIALVEQVWDAYTHLHNLDLLQESPLVSQSVIQENLNRRKFMAEAQALRLLLGQAADQVIQDTEEIQYLAKTRTFLLRYLEGKKVVEIAEELGISREWCSTKYKKEALRLAVAQFIANL